MGQFGGEKIALLSAPSFSPSFPLFRIVSSNLFAASALALLLFFQIICLSALISRADKLPLSNH